MRMEAVLLSFTTTVKKQTVIRKKTKNRVVLFLWQIPAMIALYIR
jgi:hypothetical protein